MERTINMQKSSTGAARRLIRKAALVALALIGFYAAAVILGEPVDGVGMAKTVALKAVAAAVLYGCYKASLLINPELFSKR